MTKIYVLDTSVILLNPYCLDNFSNKQVVIHINVFNELDKIKTFSGNIARNARVFIRLMDELSEKGNLQKGIKTQNNTTVKVNTDKFDTSHLGDDSYVDNKIIACAQFLKQKHDVTIVSADINMRLRAKALDMKAEGFEDKKAQINELYSGHVAIENAEIGEKLKTKKTISCSDLDELKEMAPNECVFFQNELGDGISIGRKIENRIKLISGEKPWGLESKNIEQAYLIDLLLDPQVPLVTLSGISGTGKTILSIACALEAVINRKQYNNLTIYRPIQPVGTDMGYLPGELASKLEPWMSAIHDSLDYLAFQSKKSKKGISNWKNVFAQYEDKIHMEALTYIRGRSIPNAFILIDECQNTTKEEIKTILTRVGFGTKIVLTGDIEQIDNYHLDAMNNGLTHVINKFKDSALAGHVSLTKGERSPLATYAAQIL